MPEPPQPTEGPGASFGVRLIRAFVAFWRALRGLPLPSASPLGHTPRALPQRRTNSPPATAPSAARPQPGAPTGDGASPTEGAVVLLRLLQRGGRLVDFLLEEIDGAADTQLASAARLLHRGCRGTLLDHLDLAPVVACAEGEETVVPAGFSAAEIQLQGDAGAAPPFSGRVVHPGWRVTRCDLPGLRAGDRVVAPAQVEVSELVQESKKGERGPKAC